MPRGISPKREQEYEELKDKFEQEGRYPGREEEVAARIVNKQRAEAGETQSKPSTKQTTRKEKNGTRKNNRKSAK